MSTSAAQPAPEPRKRLSFEALAPYADTLSKSVAAIVVALYVAGFLIVSLHHSQFGFITTDPFRPRILAAGAWFLLLLAIPGWVAVQVLRATRGFAEFLLFACTSLNLLALVLGPVFIDTSADGSIVLWPILTLTVSAAVVIGLQLNKRLAKGAATISVTVSVVVLLCQWSLIHKHGFGVNGLAVWFTGILVAILYRYNTWSGERRQQVELYDVLAPAFGILFAFSTYIYPHIKSSWGGGTLTPATVYFGKEAPIKAGQAVSAQVVEESDQGFYIVAPNEKKAVFVPRSSVTLIYFGDKPSESVLLR